MAEWSTEKAGFWDTAIRGSNALRGALVRAFVAEANTLLGLTTITFFADVEKFFDSLDPYQLLSRLADLELPALMLLLQVLCPLLPSLVLLPLLVLLLSAAAAALCNCCGSRCCCCSLIC